MNFQDTDHPSAAYDQPYSSGFGSQPSLKNELVAMFRMLRRQTPLIIGGALAGMVVLAFYSLTATPLYRATVQISLDPRSLASIETSDERGRRVDAPQSDSARVDTMVEALKSTPVVNRLVRDLELNRDPEFNGSRASFTRRIINLVSGSATPPSEEERILAATEIIKQALMVERSTGTYIVSAGIPSESPEKSAQLADGLADAYITNQLNANFETTRAAAQWMQARLTELSAQALKADTAVVEYKSSNGIVTSDGKLVADKVLGDISTKLTEATAELSEKKARLDRVVQVNQSQDIDASVTDAATNDVVVSLRKQYIEAQNRATELAQRYGDNHNAVLKFRRDAANILEGIRSELRRIEENYRSDYNVTLSREQSLRDELKKQFQKNIDVGQNQIKLQELESTAQAARVAYQDMLKRYTETVQKQSFPFQEARILSRATVPTQKFKPRPALLIPVGGLLGLMIGLAIGVVRDMLDKAIRTRRDASAATGAECLGFFPLVAPSTNPKRPLTFAKTGHQNAAELPWDYVMQEPFSVGAEAIRSVKVALDHRRGANRIIGVVSSLPGEGKSTISSMLAHLFADSGSKVLLIDSDLRHPALSRRIYPSAKVGLVDVITRTVAFEDAIVRDLGGNIDFLPALSQQRTKQSHEILGSKAMKTFLAAMAESYDYVVLDLPPMLPVVDVRTVAPYLDAFVFVIAWSKTPQDVVQAALETSPVVRDKLVGSILNLVRLDKVERYGEYVKSYYSDKYHNA